MSTFGVATRYAQALLETAEEKNKFDRISSDIEIVYNTVDKSKELRNFLKNPIIREEKKLSVIKELFGKHLDSDTINFLLFIVEKKREDLLTEILIRFIELRDDIMGLVNVEISSPIKLEDRERTSFEGKLEAYTKKKIRASYREDKNLIGGFTIKIKDSIIDASVSHKLELLRKTLTQ
jgi:F-type H+-transporting ATPase subunit delta